MEKIRASADKNTRKEEKREEGRKRGKREKNKRTTHDN